MATEQRRLPLDQSRDQPSNSPVSRQGDAKLPLTGAQLTDILDNLSDAVFTLDDHWRITYLNRKAEEYIGKRRDDLLGRIIWEEFPQVVGVYPYHEILGAMKERQPATLEYLSPTLDRWTSLLIYPSGTGLMLHFTDITARKQAELALRASEERFRLLFEHSPDGIWLLDLPAPDGSLTILECNPAAAEMHGYTRAELIGQPIQMFVVLPDDPERFRRDARGLEDFRRDGVSHGEDQHRRKDGTVITIEYLARQVTLDGRDLVLAVERDITAYKHAEEERERLIYELQFARDLAEQGSRAKSEFLSNMSHELRTPLFTILGYAELMTNDRPKPEHQEYLTYISSAGDHLLALVNDLLDLSRIEVRGTTMLLQPTTIAPVVQDSVQLVRRQATERGISIHVQHGRDEEALADPQRLHQVLVNLLSNAVKYNVDGGQVSVTWTRSDGRVRISVQDTGPGIPASLLLRLFTPFERLGAEKSAVPGSGLGLALSKQLVEGMGGTIGVVSEEGQGTTFWAELPGTS